MRGLKGLMEIVRSSADISVLLRIRRHVHDCADVAALNDDVREWNRLCDAEHEIDTRVCELKGGGR